MTFSGKENETVWLFKEALEKYLNHRCIDSAPVGGMDGFSWNPVVEGRPYSYIYWYMIVITNYSIPCYANEDLSLTEEQNIQQRYLDSYTTNDESKDAWNSSPLSNSDYSLGSNTQQGDTMAFAVRFEIFLLTYSHPCWHYSRMGWVW